MFVMVEDTVLLNFRYWEGRVEHVKVLRFHPTWMLESKVLRLL